MISLTTSWWMLSLLTSNVIIFDKPTTRGGGGASTTTTSRRSATVIDDSSSSPLSSSSSSTQSSSTSQSSQSSLRAKLLEILSRNEKAHLDPTAKSDFGRLLQEYGQSPDADPDDVLFSIGSAIFNTQQAAPVEAVQEEEEQEDSKSTTDNDVDDGSVIEDFDFMKAFMKDVFISYGVPEDRADTCAEVLVEADRRGIDSHGLGRLKPIYCDRMDQGILRPSMPIDIVRETDTTALLDGNLGMGLYIGPYAMQMAIDKAKKHGVAFVAVRNSTHYGIAGYYATMATKAGCIGWTGTNARPSIAPTYGVEPMLGTNPLCFGIPTDEDFDFCIDCATSINQRGKIEKYARDGVPTPRGVVIDNQGIERTDTEGILRDMVLGKCALNPMGGAGDRTAGYKGYSWATVVELLSTAIQSGPFGEGVCGVDRATGAKKPMPLGHYFLAINVEALCDLGIFRKNAGNLLRALRDSQKSPLGPGRIWTAGEPEHDERLARQVAGGMKVPVPLQQAMTQLRDQRPGLKEKYPQFPWET